MVMSVVGFDGEIVFDVSKPDGTPRKLSNVDQLKKLGWQANTSLRDGIAKAYADFLSKRPQ
jgi:GDP-L-fucose synthase